MPKGGTMSRTSQNLTTRTSPEIRVQLKPTNRQRPSAPDSGLYGTDDGKE